MSVIFITEERRTLKCDVSSAFVKMSELAGNMINCEHTGKDGEAVPLFKVNHETLLTVVEYCDKRCENGWCDSDSDSDGDTKIVLEDWEADFCKKHYKQRCSLVNAADYLRVDSLYSLMLKLLLEVDVRGKSAEHMRKVFNVVNDWEDGEEEKARKAWRWESL
jgi:S-phase kinase-associated protein 1